MNGVFTTTFTGGAFKPVGKQVQLLEVNVFSWTEQYSVLLAQVYKSGMLVRFHSVSNNRASEMLTYRQVSAATMPSPIAFGQEIDYANGTLGPAQIALASAFTPPMDAKDSFILGSVPQNLAAAVATKMGSDWIPIFVDNAPHVGLQSKQLTPINEVCLRTCSENIQNGLSNRLRQQYCLFFDSIYASGSMIDYSKTANPFTFSFDQGSITKALRYGYANPNNPSGPTEQPTWYPATY